MCWAKFRHIIISVGKIFLNGFNTLQIKMKIYIISNLIKIKPPFPALWWPWKIFSVTETYFFVLPRVVAKKFGTLEQNRSTFAERSFSVENTWNSSSNAELEIFSKKSADDLRSKGQVWYAFWFAQKFFSTNLAVEKFLSKGRSQFSFINYLVKITLPFPALWWPWKRRQLRFRLEGYWCIYPTSSRNIRMKFCMGYTLP